MRRRALLALALAAPLVPEAARAQAIVGVDTPGDGAEPDLTPPQDAHFELGARAAYTTNPVAGGLSPFGPGLGGRIGLAIHDVYVGGSIVDYLGASDASGSAQRAILYGLELGYDVWVTNVFRLRPVVGAGGATIYNTVPPDPNAPKVDVVTSASGGGGGSGDNTSAVTTFYVEPGILGSFTSKSGAFVGGGASVLVLPSVTLGPGETSTWLSYSVSFQVGQRF